MSRHNTQPSIPINHQYDDDYRANQHVIEVVRNMDVEHRLGKDDCAIYLNARRLNPDDVTNGLRLIASLFGLNDELYEALSSEGHEEEVQDEIINWLNHNAVDNTVTFVWTMTNELELVPRKSETRV